MGKKNQKTSCAIEQEIVSLYYNNTKSIEIAAKYDISTGTLYRILNRCGVKSRGVSMSNRKYKLNESFFDAITTEEQAYFLGLLYADGYNNEQKTTIALQLWEKDEEILLKFKAALGTDRPLVTVDNTKYNSNATVARKLVISSVHISSRLAKLGCGQAKTFKIKFPNFLMDNLTAHFIRGYYDGDGGLTIYWVDHRGYKHKQAGLTITSTESFCNKVKEIFNTQLGVNSHVVSRFKPPTNNIRTLQISGDRQINKVLDWLYKDASMYMERKYRKYQELKDILALRDAKRIYTPRGTVRYCEYPGCSNKHDSKGLCPKHRTRQRRHRGDSWTREITSKYTSGYVTGLQFKYQSLEE